MGTSSRACRRGPAVAIEARSPPSSGATTPPPTTFDWRFTAIDGHEQAPITEAPRPPRTFGADHLASMPTATLAEVAAGESGWATAAATLTGMAHGMARFVQTFPPLPDVYAGDHVLRATLVRLLGEVGHKSAAPLLEALAAEVAGQLRAAHTDAETHPPILRRYDAWGRRVDEVATAPGWEVLRQASARHGLVALPYEPDARASWGAGAPARPGVRRIGQRAQSVPGPALAPDRRPGRGRLLVDPPAPGVVAAQDGRMRLRVRVRRPQLAGGSTRWR